ncbi:MAG: 6-aminohexanoate hydrolase [Novosphingobium sp. 16-62-11]|uniref:serine hydrolase domain-containing protein n=1 Tax=Novosphingobium sp. 17-62-19 TaxID=1970406 RepID=UPI000BC62DED|nr:serine hydrolase [Novosphingobium sp. 17-62-19]OYX91717.1 MAG: 6-aminohexanoate hydrolase [Novosphingobium sp. 35-62-5]OYZ42174.1 MAG: 6-aminohexanoate hydrolase [Novosphingobium sp. 16-62-11]OZA19633.1 MAG: 6-aminohexanoate hydrolase [Novosphingobium sp. 17-62-19]HQS96729.1 serine hydrolase [Novosphingobium sp.]
MSGEMLDGVTSDPLTMGWMQGIPPLADRLLLTSRADHMRFPMIRWSYSNMRQFVPSRRVGAGVGGKPFERALRDELAEVPFTPLNCDATVTFWESLTQAFTDGILVLHRGKVVFERWFGVTGPETRHIAFSVTKSFVGTIAEMLLEEGRLDPATPVAHYLPELANSGFGDASVQQVMHMTTALDFSEDYADPNSGIGAYSAALGLTPRPDGYAGPTNLASYLPTISKAGEHGQGFTYRTPNTEVLAWLIARIEGKHFADILSERLWQPLGMLGDADLIVDQAGMAFAGGGLSLRLEDLARFGEAMRLGGVGVVSPRVVERIRRGGDPAHFDRSRYPQLPGWSYGSQWWHSHNNRGCFSARGIHGQTIWVDPEAEMTIARFASHPIAANGANDPLSLPAWEAMAHALKC